MSVMLPYVPTPSPFYLVDVFAVQPLTGNPLALVPDADHLDDAVMRAIAREFNQSETTFLLDPTLPGADRRLRSFTPAGHEVGGAGHNALGAWLWLAEAGRLDLDGVGTAFVQEIVGELSPLRVVREPGRPLAVTMDQGRPRFLATIDDPTELAAALGLPRRSVRDDLPVQVVDTGAGHLHVPLRDPDAVDCATPDSARLAAVLRAVGGEGVYLYSLGGPDGAVASARFFNPTMGIVEDAATGTAAGPLGALLVRLGIVDEGAFVIEQGAAMGRPSRIGVLVEGDRVAVSGSGVVSAAGVLFP